MTYEEAVNYLFTVTPVFQNTGATAYKEGLDNILALDRHFASPHKAYKTIHVAGTNGKGSTSHTLASILQSEGYKVGLFTSPHLLDFRERIRVNGQMIDKERVCRFVEEVKDLVEEIKPSFFELTTMLALLYFKEQKVDFAIIEVGLGGRLDSTNIISPILSIITNISADHTQFLGKDLSSIAREKAGIIKAKTPVVIGESLEGTRAIFETIAEDKHAEIYFAEEENQIKAKHSKHGTFLYKSKKYGNFEGELAGSVQVRNTQTVLTAIDCLKDLGVKLSQEAIHRGFAEVSKLTGLLGRWQTLQEQPFKIICDTAHNEAGLQEVLKQVKATEHKHLHIVIGFAKDKDIKSMLQLLPKEAKFYFTQAQGERALSSEILRTQAQDLGISGESFPSVALATERAMQVCEEGDLLFLGGSNFIVAEVLAYYNKH